MDKMSNAGNHGYSCHRSNRNHLLNGKRSTTDLKQHTHVHVHEHEHQRQSREDMTVTVCFDALGTCFSLEPVIQALDELMGDELRSAGACPRMTIWDWVSQSLYV